MDRALFVRGVKPKRMRGRRKQKMFAIQAVHFAHAMYLARAFHAHNWLVWIERGRETALSPTATL